MEASTMEVAGPVLTSERFKYIHIVGIVDFNYKDVHFAMFSVTNTIINEYIWEIRGQCECFIIFRINNSSSQELPLSFAVLVNFVQISKIWIQNSQFSHIKSAYTCVCTCVCICASFDSFQNTLMLLSFLRLDNKPQQDSEMLSKLRVMTLI